MALKIAVNLPIRHYGVQQALFPNEGVRVLDEKALA